MSNVISLVPTVLEPFLAASHDALCRLGSEGRLVIAPRLMTWSESGTALVPAQTVSSPIGRVSAEGRTTIVHCPPRRTVVGHALRWKNAWLLVSERYSAPNVVLFPSSPVFRYYRAD